jgi:hypothetical protein
MAVLILVVRWALADPDKIWIDRRVSSRFGGKNEIICSVRMHWAWMVKPLLAALLGSLGLWLFAWDWWVVAIPLVLAGSWCWIGNLLNSVTFAEKSIYIRWGVPADFLRIEYSTFKFEVDNSIIGNILGFTRVLFTTTGGEKVNLVVPMIFLRIVEAYQNLTGEQPGRDFGRYGGHWLDASSARAWRTYIRTVYPGYLDNDPTATGSGAPGAWQVLERTDPGQNPPLHGEYRFGWKDFSQFHHSMRMAGEPRPGHLLGILQDAEKGLFLPTFMPASPTPTQLAVMTRWEKVIELNWPQFWEPDQVKRLATWKQRWQEFEKMAINQVLKPGSGSWSRPAWKRTSGLEKLRLTIAANLMFEKWIPPWGWDLGIRRP